MEGTWFVASRVVCKLTACAIAPDVVVRRHENRERRHILSQSSDVDAVAVAVKATRCDHV